MVDAQYSGRGGKVITRNRCRIIPKSSKILCLISKCDLLCMTSWNVQGGLNEVVDYELVIKDLVQQKVDIVCLQETHNNEKETKFVRDETVMCLESHPDTLTAAQCYELGFFISDPFHRIISIIRPYLIVLLFYTEIL